MMGRANTKSVSGAGRFNYRKKGRKEGEPDPERQSKGGPCNNVYLMPLELIIIDDRNDQ